MNEHPSLYEWAGGGDAFARLINAFYDRVEHDPLLSPFFPGGVTVEHRSHVVAWWAEVFGGPDDYTAQYGGYEAMLSHHRELGITTAQRLRFATLMSQAADDAELPSDPEFRAALVGYLEWALDWRCTTPCQARLSLHMRQCRSGAGASHRPISRSGAARIS